MVQKLHQKKMIHDKQNLADIEKDPIRRCSKKNHIRNQEILLTKTRKIQFSFFR